jgi:hypothetical protein
VLHLVVATLRVPGGRCAFVHALPGIRRGEPATVLLDQALRADLLVVETAAVAGWPAP